MEIGLLIPDLKKKKREIHKILFLFFKEYCKLSGSTNKAPSNRNGLYKLYATSTNVFRRRDHLSNILLISYLLDPNLEATSPMQFHIQGSLFHTDPCLSGSAALLSKLKLFLLVGKDILQLLILQFKSLQI
jgi:hypothetical protein